MQVVVRAPHRGARLEADRHRVQQAGVLRSLSAQAFETMDSFVRLMQGRGQVEPDEEVLEDAIAFAGVAKYPARVKCALLGWMAFKDALAQACSDGEADSKEV